MNEALLAEFRANNDVKGSVYEDVTEKKRIRAYSKEYYEWIKPEKKGIKITGIQLEQSKGEECDACNGTGIWVGTKYRRKCFRCRGTGRIDRVQANRNKFYDSVVAQGTKRASFGDYNNESWSMAH